jgi:DNA-binding transcriptional LysR family regulator
MLDLRRLRLLRELEARGTVHGAARALDYTPSAVSQQLAVLEREAGAPLLERSGRLLRLTDAGRLLVAHAATLLDGMAAAEADLAALVAGRPAGTVRVASFQSAFLELVAPMVAAVQRDHPEVRVEAAEIEVEEAVPALRLGHLDAVVGDEYEGDPRPVHKDLERTPLLTEQVRVVLRADHPLAARARVPLARLADAAWAGTHAGTGHRDMHVRACRRLGGFEPDVRYESDDLLILLEMVRSTGACGLLPDLVLRREHPGVAARPLAGGSQQREVFLLTRRASTPAVTVVADALRAVSGRRTGRPSPGGRRASSGRRRAGGG